MSSTRAFWSKFDAMEARLTAPLSERMLDLAALGPGMQVLDVACGRGEPSLRAAHRVGPGGTVLGIDRDEGALELAIARAASESLANIEFRLGEAETMRFEAGAFDVATCRWGLMYMEDPTAALLRMARALRPHGKLVAAVWCVPALVPYYTLPRAVLARFRSVPEPSIRARGTFRYADETALASHLQAAGLRITHTEEFPVTVAASTDAEELVTWSRGLGLDTLLADLAPSMQEAWARDLVRQLESTRHDGFVQLGGISRLVVAERGEL